MRGNVVAKVVEFCEHNRADPMNEIPKVILGSRALQSVAVQSCGSLAVVMPLQKWPFFSSKCFDPMTGVQRSRG